MEGGWSQLTPAIPGSVRVLTLDSRSVVARSCRSACVGYSGSCSGGSIAEDCNEGSVANDSKIISMLE